ncbi:M56 family metallopeptidase [Undibacterium flavidum]|uniref:Serine hydrolase n=1 Tax=Undibacterium flavidum TaxID=2762297 RepID=A0ABR6Y648_9BURK|nr:M56 family metallopeptidase [Undibacterium flavidum]MBC3872097.1 serine hydrolase [Undibacterium flavidum]
MPAHSLTDLLGWPLLNFVWQGALVASVCAILLAFSRNARPQWRYLLACSAMLVCLLWPALGVLKQWHDPQAISLHSAIQMASELGASLNPIWIEQSMLTARIEAWLPLLVSVWSIGVLLMLLRLALGLLWVYRLGQHGDDMGSLVQQWQIRTNQMAYQFAIRRKVHLKFQKDLLSPVTYGCLTPVVVMPVSLLTGMSPEMIEALLAHELAHIKRWDFVVNVLQNLALSLLFYHPAVWWISKRIEAERELIADDMAASILGQPLPLARALQALDKLQTAGLTQAAMAANGGDLLSRIKRLVRPDVQPWHWKMAAPVLGITGALFLVLQTQVNAAPDQAAPAKSTIQALAQPHSQPQSQPHSQLSAYVKTSSEHVLVMDEQSGQILLEKNADSAVPIASLSKLVTAMVTLDAKLDMNEMITLDKEDIAGWQTTQVKLYQGMRLSRQTLLELSLIPSSNAAAQALARSYPGGKAMFVSALQAKIASQGLLATHLEEATGISPNNRSSARDLAHLVKLAASYPQLRQLTSRSEGQYRRDGKVVDYQSTNPLIADKNWDISLSKTGYSKNAGRCISMRTTIAGRPIIVVLLNAKNSDVRTDDVMHIRTALEDATSG